MKYIIILTISLFSFAINAQGNYADKDIIGIYEYRRQEIKGAVAYSTITIELMQNKTFVYNSSSHILGGSTESKGVWEVVENILVLTNEDKSIDKYLITKKGLFKEPKTRKSICLKKVNKQTTN